MRFYINPQGVVSLPVNFGYFYKFTVTSGPYLAIEEVTNGASGQAVFAGLVNNLSEEDVFKMCYFAVDAKGYKDHKRKMYPALRWVMKNLWRRAKLDSPPIGSTFTKQGMLNALGESSDELINKVSEALIDLASNDTCNHDLLISVTVSRSVARNPAAPDIGIAVLSEDEKPARVQPRRADGGKRAGTPQTDEDEDGDAGDD